MSNLSNRLDAILTRQLGLLRELRAAKSELAIVHSRVRMRLAELEEQEREAEAHYREALAEDDLQAEVLRALPERIGARIEELKSAEADLEATELSLAERIRHAEQDVEDFRVLQPQVIAASAAARSAGVAREVSETLADALSYIDLVLDAAEGDDPNGPVTTRQT